MASSSALPKAKAKAKVRARRTAKYDHLPKDLRGAAKFLDEKNLIANINKAMNRDGRVEVPLPRGDDPAHVGRVLGDIVRRIDRSAGRSTRRSSSPSTASESTNARIGRTVRRVHARLDDDEAGRPRNLHQNDPCIRRIQSRWRGVEPAWQHMKGEDRHRRFSTAAPRRARIRWDCSASDARTG